MQRVKRGVRLVYFQKAVLLSFGRDILMDCCATCSCANDTVEIGYYFQCDKDRDIHWKDECCDSFERRVGIIASYDEIAQETDELE